jgi:hypothetical protein
MLLPLLLLSLRLQLQLLQLLQLLLPMFAPACYRCCCCCCFQCYCFCNARATWDAAAAAVAAAAVSAAAAGATQMKLCVVAAAVARGCWLLRHFRTTCRNITHRTLAHVPHKKTRHQTQVTNTWPVLAKVIAAASTGTIRAARTQIVIFARARHGGDDWADEST